MDGILAKLGQDAGAINIVVGDASEPLLGQVIEQAPDVVLLEKKTLLSPTHCSLNILFAAVPNLVLVEIDETTGELQFIGSQQMQPKGISDLLSYLNKVCISATNSERIGA